MRWRQILRVTVTAGLIGSLGLSGSLATTGCGDLEPLNASGATEPVTQRGREAGRRMDPALLCKPGMTADISFADLFEELGVEGSLLIYDETAERCYQHEGGLNRQSYPPASTFKIFNSLVALETGAVEDEHEVFTWDGVERMVESWNRDHDLASAIRYSAVWVYQEIARRIGREAMQKHVDDARYGNQRLGDDITTFWLDGSLRITPEQQVKMLMRLADGALPFSERSQEIVRRILIVDETPEYTLRAKTGWSIRVEGEPDIGWWVGYLTRGDERYFFATRIHLPTGEQAPARLEVTRRALQRIGKM